MLQPPVSKFNTLRYFLFSLHPSTPQRASALLPDMTCPARGALSNAITFSFPVGALTSISNLPDLMLDTKRNMPGTTWAFLAFSEAPFVVSSPSIPDMGVPSFCATFRRVLPVWAFNSLLITSFCRVEATVRNPAMEAGSKQASDVPYHFPSFDPSAAYAFVHSPLFAFVFQCRTRQSFSLNLESKRSAPSPCGYVSGN